MELMQWLLEQHETIVQRTKIVHEEEISFSELNRRMAEYGSDYAWAISEDTIAEHAYQRKKLQFDRWYNPLFVAAKKNLPTGASAKSVEALVSTSHKEVWDQWKEELLQLKLQQRTREQFLKVWGSMKDIYVEIARNMRSDWQSAGGLSIKSSGEDRVIKIKKIRKLKRQEEKDGS